MQDEGASTSSASFDTLTMTSPQQAHPGFLTVRGSTIRPFHPIRILMSDINAVSFGTTIDMLGNAIAGADLEQNAIAENIANVNTPGYGRESVPFKDALAAAAGQPQGDELGMMTDDGRQFAIGSQAAPQPFDPQVQVDTTDRMRADGSNVDVDQESALLSQNSGYSQTMSQLLQVQFMRLRQAITEQP